MLDGTSSMLVDFTENNGVGRALQGLDHMKTSKKTMFFANRLKTPVFSDVFAVSTVSRPISSHRRRRGGTRKVASVRAFQSA
jgi:hypothetical protein